MKKTRITFFLPPNQKVDNEAKNILQIFPLCVYYNVPLHISINNKKNYGKSEAE